MSRAVMLAPAVLSVHRAVTGVDVLQDLHAEVLQSGGSSHTAFGDLSDGICAALGQLLATGPVAGAAMLDTARKAAERRGLEGLESVLLSAFLSAARSGVTSSTVAAAAYAASPDLLDRLAGGARRVPLADAASASIGSVSLSELAVAMGAAGGSVAELANRLRALVTLGGSADDDPTLPPVAYACADAYAAVITADRYAAADAVADEAAAELGTAMNVDPTSWRRPAAHLLAGSAVTLGLRLTGAVAEVDTAHVGAVPAGLVPRPRRGSTAADAPATSQGQRVPGAVTTDVMSWVTTLGRTAELDPPRALRPAPDPSVVLDPQREWVQTTPRTVRLRGRLVPTGLTPQLDVLTGQPVDIHGNPIPEWTEATLAEARLLGVDPNTVSVGDFTDLLIRAAQRGSP